MGLLPVLQVQAAVDARQDRGEGRPARPRAHDARRERQVRKVLFEVGWTKKLIQGSPLTRGVMIPGLESDFEHFSELNDSNFISSKNRFLYMYRVRLQI